MGGALITGGVGNYRNSLAAALLIVSIISILQFLQVNIWYQFAIKGVLLISVAGAQLTIARRRGIVV
jgi:ribose/xylose/arabinose/galactoside ABC-type transport system permease subunit